MSKKHHSKSTYTLSLALQRELVSDINAEALYLYNYYVSKAYVTHFNLLDDILVGRSIGWTSRKVKHYRLKLSNTGWIHFEQETHKGIVRSTWILGKKDVTEFQEGSKLLDHDLVIAETIIDSNYDVQISTKNEI